MLELSQFWAAHLRHQRAFYKLQYYHCHCTQIWIGKDKSKREKGKTTTEHFNSVTSRIFLFSSTSIAIALCCQLLKVFFLSPDLLHYCALVFYKKSTIWLIYCIDSPITSRELLLILKRNTHTNMNVKLHSTTQLSHSTWASQNVLKNNQYP